MASGWWGGSTTVVEELEPDQSWNSPKETHGGYTLSGENRFSMKQLEDSLDFKNCTWTEETNTSAQPRNTSAQPRITSAQPRNTSAQPRNTSAQPRNTSAQPRNTSAQPRITSALRNPSAQPRITSTQPQSTSTQPRSRLSSVLLRETRTAPARRVTTRVTIPKTRAYRVKTALEQTSNKEEEEELLDVVRRQFPDMRKFMKNRFPGKSFGLALKKVNFEKVQKDFSEVFRLKKLISLGESVCVLFVGDIRQGSGFVLFDNFILTNAHLLSEVLYENGRTLTLTVPVKAVFNYENKPFGNNSMMCEVYNEVIDLDRTMDYAVLRLKNQENQAVPPGLLPYFGPKPDDGGAGIIGHPGGEVKKIDLTFIIGKNERQSAANQQLEPYDDSTRMVIVQNVVEEGIDNIWCADLVITYNTTNMFHGSSGSPLIDDECRVVGLHSAGFLYEYKGQKHSVIAYAHSVLEIFSRFVYNIGITGGMDLLKEIAQNSGDNPHLRRIFQSYGLV